MDPSVIAAMVTTAGGLASKLVDSWRRGGPTTSEESDRKEIEAKAEAVVTLHYDKLTDGVTNNSLKVLRYLEGGDPRRPKEIWRFVFKGLDMPEEFEYRLKYLQVLGLVREGVNEYRVTPLGRAFLAEARRRKDYFEALFH